MKKFRVTLLAMLLLAVLVINCAVAEPGEEVELDIESDFDDVNMELNYEAILDNIDVSLDFPIPDSSLESYEPVSYNTNNIISNGNNADTLTITKCILSSFYQSTSSGILYKVECAASGGVEPYTFKYELYRERDLIYNFDYYFDKNEWNWYGNDYLYKQGIYYALVTVKDAANNTITAKSTNHIIITKGAYAIQPSCPDCRSPYSIEDSAIKETCTTDGLTKGTHCAECGTIILAQERIPALGHDWPEEWEDNDDGYLRRTCNRCDETQAIPKDPTCEHNDKRTIKRLEPTS